MSDKFKAIVIDNQNEKFSREIKEINKNELKDGNVLIKVDYSSLNYKDALILNNGGKIVRKFPFVPGIDFSGKVIESESNKFLENVLRKGGERLNSGHAGLWRTSIQMWKEEPIFGFGLKSFRFKCRDIVSKAGNSNIITSIETTAHMHYFDCSNHPHNYYFEFLSETGIIGTLLIVIFFILILKDFFYYIKKYNKYFNFELMFVIPIMLTIFLEIWPIRSTGSFFSSWNATGFWIFIALLSVAKRSKKINFSSKY